MHWYGSGFITIINYSSIGEASQQADFILTENNLDILTESGHELETEAA